MVEAPPKLDAAFEDHALYQIKSSVLKAPRLSRNTSGSAGDGVDGQPGRLESRQHKSLAGPRSCQEEESLEVRRGMEFAFKMEFTMHFMQTGSSYVTERGSKRGFYSSVGTPTRTRTSWRSPRASSSSSRKRSPGFYTTRRHLSRRSRRCKRLTVLAWSVRHGFHGAEALALGNQCI